MMLAMAQSGEEFIVTEILCGCKLKKMLQERGLTEGVNIKVIKGQPKGPFIVEFRSSRIMLDGTCAQKIMVGQVKEGEHENFERCEAGGNCHRHRHQRGWNG